MLSALSVAEFCLKEAARLAAMRRLRASWRCRSWRSRERSRVTPPRPLAGRFGRGGGHFRSYGKQIESKMFVIIETYGADSQFLSISGL